MVGRTVSNYRIVEKLGEGGMGVVFKAFDIRLERHLALKFLSAKRIGGEETERRFILEARAASALNHPNIIHIYDVGQFEGTSYIAMEYVEGRTLTSILHGRPMDLSDVLRYGIQIADAMASAHSAGIIHRDLKPANIMITARGLVKILDFGLSKLTEAAPSRLHNPSSDTTEIDPLVTGAGVILGTPAYMSPEQAKGAELDTRADIFALGLILFEMATGRTGFPGANKIEILAAILHEELAAPSSINPHLTPEFDWVVARCLRKDRNLRFQSMADVRAALEDVQRSLQDSQSARSSGRSGALASPVTPSRFPGRLWLWALPVLALLAAGGAWLVSRSGSASPPKLNLVKLTPEAGLNRDPAISADGKLLAYASDRAGDGNLDIWLKQIGGGEAIRLTTDPADESEPCFSPDGTRIAFRSERDGGGVYLVSTLGGEARKIADGGRRPRFSPDGTRLVFWTGPLGSPGRLAGEGAVWITNLTSGTTNRVGSDFAAATAPIWIGPDRILLIGSRYPDPFSSWDWYVVPLDGSPPARCNALKFGGDVEYRLPFEWRNGEVIYSTAATGESHVSALPLSERDWQPRGEPHRLTFGTAREDQPSLSANGAQLVFASMVQNLDVYAFSPAGHQEPPLRRLTRDTSAEVLRAASADGRRFAVISDRTGIGELYILDAASGQMRVIDPSGFPKSAPVFHPSGAEIAFVDHRRPANLVYVSPVDGGRGRRVCDSCGQPSAWSADGRFLLYSLYDAHSEISKLDLQTGARSVYLRHPTESLYPRTLSPDGRWFSFILNQNARPGRILIAPFDAERPPAESAWIPITEGTSNDAYPQWSPSLDALYFVSDRDSWFCLWKQPLDPQSKRPRGQPVPVRHFHNPSLRIESSVRWFVVTPNSIALTLEEVSGAIWMLDREVSSR